MNIPDNYDMWLEHQRKEDMWLESLPKCCECGKPIQQERVVYLHGEYYCDNCLEEARINIEV